MWQPDGTQEEGGGNSREFQGIFHRVRVSKLYRGPQKRESLLFYRRLDCLRWDPRRLQWPRKEGTIPFMEYNVKLGRELLQDKHEIPNPMERKWQGILPMSQRLRWNTVWAKPCAPKESGLLWLVWHRAVAVNAWRGRIDGSINTNCPMCTRPTIESVLHRFWECPLARLVWQWGTHILNTLISGKEAKGPWRPLK